MGEGVGLGEGVEVLPSHLSGPLLEVKASQTFLRWPPASGPSPTNPTRGWGWCGAWWGGWWRAWWGGWWIYAMVGGSHGPTCGVALRTGGSSPTSSPMSATQAQLA